MTFLLNSIYSVFHCFPTTSLCLHDTDNRVCLIKERANKPFHSLKPGECYVVASLGSGIVVEVLEDARATPTSNLPADHQKAARKWKNAKLKREQQAVNIATSATVKSLTRRRRLGTLYQERKQRQQTQQSKTAAEPEQQQVSFQG